MFLMDYLENKQRKFDIILLNSPYFALLFDEIIVKIKKGPSVLSVIIYIYAS
jgi:hypothetical protein